MPCHCCMWYLEAAAVGGKERGTWLKRHRACGYFVVEILIRDHPVTELSHHHREPQAHADQYQYLTYGAVKRMTTPLSDRRSMS